VQPATCHATTHCLVLQRTQHQELGVLLLHSHNPSFARFNTRFAVTGLPLDVANEVLLLALGCPGPGWRLSGSHSAAELAAIEAAPPSDWPRAARCGHVSTGCVALDALLGGRGVACGTVTEFCEGLLRPTLAAAECGVCSTRPAD
jgi:hypothetical protein